MLHEQNGARANIITHVHTDASAADACALDDRISAALRWCAKGTHIAWAECFTTIERLEALLRRGTGDHGPVDMILITDHMRNRSHRLPERHLAAAARTQSIGLGAELATRTRDVDGEYHEGPEILAYGGRHRVEGPFGPYYGLPQSIIDELYDTCLDDEGQELSTRRARALLARRNIAHGLSHPFDGHGLSLEATLMVVCEFPFIEVVNGGYSASSARVLDAFVRLNNALVSGAWLPEAELSPMGRRIVDHIRRNGRVIHALGGSDSHSHDFDRVVTTMDTGGRQPEAIRPGDFYQRMLAHHRGKGVGPAPFGSIGRAATTQSLLSDLSAIILRNIRFNFRSCKNPYTWTKIVATTLFITHDEVSLRQQHQKRRMRQLESDFDPVRLLPLLRGVTERQDHSVGLFHSSPPPGLAALPSGGA